MESDNTSDAGTPSAAGNAGAQNVADQTGLSELVELLTQDCVQRIQMSTKPDDGQLYCETAIDQWGGCWLHTPAGTVATLACNETLFSFHQPLKHAAATRKCEANGTWFISPKSHKAYINYTACTHSTQDLGADNHDTIPIYIFIAGYSVSIVMLLISLVIFFAFRQLRCERITVHKNLLVSYVFTGVTWILYFLLVSLDGDVLIQNPAWCQLLHVLANYFATCNFAWMFCEGLYLHIIMAHTFRTGKMLIRVLLFVGWGCPMILIIIYASVRGAKQSHTEMCWLDDDEYLWIIAGPVVASVIVNIIILINLVRLLVTKLRQVPDTPQHRKVVRATLILVPLFGIQHLIFPLRPEEGDLLFDFYHYVIALLTSLQGTLVSVMFCFCNGEVTSLLRRKWHQHRLMTGHVRKNTALTSSTYTEGYTMVNTSTRDMSAQKDKVAPDHHSRPVPQDSVEMKPLKMEKQET